MRLTDKCVVVTGGATGIGLELARQLVARGNRVAICGRRRAKIEAAAEAVPGLSGLACDLSQDAGIKEFVDFIRATFQTLDILINNAGVQVQMDLRQGTGEFQAVNEELMTNLGAPIKLTQALLPWLLERPEAAIINITSLLGVMPKANAPGYCASKAGLYGFTKALQLAVAGTSVKAFTVFPPLVSTPMTEGRGADKMEPADFVREMLRQLEQDRREIRVGQAETILRLYRISPGLAGRWVRRISTRPGKET